MEIRALRASELDAAFDLDADAFHQGEDKRAQFVRYFDPSRIVGAFEADRLIAMSSALEFGQYFGARSVPMGGLSAVAVVPDARGRGLGKQLIRGCMEAMRERGEVVSSLYPATTSLYRALGWELGGSLAILKAQASSLRGLARPESGRTRRLTEEDWPAVHAAYDGLASTVNGCLDRPPRWWEAREFAWKDRDVYVFEGAGGALEGYLIYHQIDGEWSHLGGDFGIVVDEFVTLTRDAGLGLWGLLGSWAPQVDQISFRGATDASSLLLLPEQIFETLAELRWMTRVVDAAGAVAARGYPAGLDVEVALRLRDDIVVANDGDFVLTVQKGRGTLAAAQGGTGPSIDVRGFSSLYTGWADTAMLGRAGLLFGGSSEQRAALDAAFAGNPPWMLDEF